MTLKFKPVFVVFFCFIIPSLNKTLSFAVYMAFMILVWSELCLPATFFHSNALRYYLTEEKVKQIFFSSSSCNCSIEKTTCMNKTNFTPLTSRETDNPTCEDGLVNVFSNSVRGFILATFTDTVGLSDTATYWGHCFILFCCLQVAERSWRGDSKIWILMFFFLAYFQNDIYVMTNVYLYTRK